jgi:intein-encoded DNA endonuclease-like protein
MKDWLIIKCDYDFVEKNREQLQKIAKNLNTRVVMIFSSNN